MNKYTRFTDMAGEIPCSLRDMIKHEPEWVVSRFEFMEARVTELETQVKGLTHNAGVINDAAHTIIEFTKDTIPAEPPE